MFNDEHIRALRIIHKTHYAFRGAVVDAFIKFFRRSCPDFSSEAFHKEAWSTEAEAISALVEKSEHPHSEDEES